MTIVYAHRGASYEQPENTLPAFQAALDLEVDALETDVHVTADGVVVVAHDASGERMAGVAAEIAATPYDQVKAWDVGWGFIDPGGNRPFAGGDYRIPSFEQLLQTYPDARFNVDVKPNSAAAVRRVIDVVRTCNACERVTLASFNLATIVAIRRAGYEGKTGISQAEAIALLATPAAVFKRLPLTGDRAQLPTEFRGVSLKRPYIINKCHAAGLTIDFWTVNSGDEAREIASLGADGIMTDDPRRIMSALGRL